MPYSFRSEQWLPYPAETVFAFFSDPENLPTLMPDWQKARVERLDRVPPPLRASATSPAKAAGVGSQIVLSFRLSPLLPFRTRWHAEIEEFVWNDHFCDRQVRGPFSYWRHCHRTRSVDRERLDITVLIDEVEYDLPFGPLGSLARSLFVERQIEAAFAFRRERLAQALALWSPPPAVPQVASPTPRLIRRP